MSVFKKCLLAAAVMAAAAGTHASTVNISKDTVNNVANIPGLTGFQTLGSMMDGMLVTATFTNQAAQTVAWADLSATAGGVTGNGWSLDVDGDTFSAAWNFRFLPVAGQTLGQLVSLVLRAAPGLTVFDTTEPSFGTNGSAQGRNFEFFGGTCANCDVDADYTEAVAITPDPPVGDIFHTLSLSFLNQSGPRTDWQFRQDTDNDARFQVPEPGALALVGLALAAAGLATRRRRIAAA